MNHLITHCADIDWSALAQLIEDAGLGRRDLELLARVFRGSYAVSFLYQEQLLIGAGRAISDGVTSSVIYDVVISPALQGQCFGRMVMEDLCARLPKRSVMLVSVPRQRGFYEKLGFLTLKTAMLKHEDPEYWIKHGYTK